MLDRLTIENYALIDRLQIDFDPRLNIITGETGAGKSIMLGALSLLLGERADSKVIAGGGSKSVVEARFTNPDSELQELFRFHDIEWLDDEIIIRREISASGRSRAFVNDQPVTLNVLQEISGKLLTIHSQNSSVHLADTRTQLRIVDAMTANPELIDSYRKEFSSYLKVRNRIRKLREIKEKALANKEFLQFQLEQLERLRPKRGELIQIEKRYEMLSDADDIRERLRSCLMLLRGGDSGCIDRLGEMKGILGKIDFSMLGEADSNVEGRLEQCYIELKDIAETFEGCLDRIEADPAMLAKMSDRINLYYEAMKRFRVADSDQLVDEYERIRESLDLMDGDSEELTELEKTAKQSARKLKTLADDLSAEREKGGALLSESLNDIARPLGLKNLKFEVRTERGKLTQDGQDIVEFYCSFNKNQFVMPLSKTASGGEMSRLLLSLENILAGRMKLPTVIFDEIDTGVSGDIADRMGRMMQGMTKEMQVISITHLPQVAARGDAHFRVYKEDDDIRTVSRMKRLTQEERVGEIASMLSGSEVKEAALENARYLLGIKY